MPVQNKEQEWLTIISQYKREFIEFMISADVLRFGKFVTKSGRNTPYFVNTGNYKTGQQISKLGDFYADFVYAEIGDSFDSFFGPAYKGIPLAVTCASAFYRRHDRDKSYFFNRKETKDHGEGGNTIGYTPKDGDRVVIIEDVITAGTALREVFPILKVCADVTVQHMFIGVDRNEVGTIPGKSTVMQVADEFGIQIHAIVTAYDIFDYLKESNMDKEVLKAMEDYMSQYCVSK